MDLIDLIGLKLCLILQISAMMSTLRVRLLFALPARDDFQQSSLLDESPRGGGEDKTVQRKFLLYVEPIQLAARRNSEPILLRTDL